MIYVTGYTVTRKTSCSRWELTLYSFKFIFQEIQDLFHSSRNQATYACWHDSLVTTFTRCQCYLQGQEQQHQDQRCHWDYLGECWKFSSGLIKSPLPPLIELAANHRGSRIQPCSANTQQCWFRKRRNGDSNHHKSSSCNFNAELSDPNSRFLRNPLGSCPLHLLWPTATLQKTGRTTCHALCQEGSLTKFYRWQHNVQHTHQIWINESKYIISYQFISSRYLYSSAMISLLFKPSTTLHWRLGWIDRPAKAIAQTHRCPETRPFEHKWHVETKPRASLKIIDNSWKETCLCTKLILLRVQILSIMSVATKVVPWKCSLCCEMWILHVLVQVCCLEEAFHAVLISLMMDLSNTWNWLEKRALPWTIPGSLHFDGFLAMGCRDAGNPQVWMDFYGKSTGKSFSTTIFGTCQNYLTTRATFKNPYDIPIFWLV